MSAIEVYYVNDDGRRVTYALTSEEHIYTLAEILLKAPIDLEYLYSENRMFNLQTFTWC